RSIAFEAGRPGTLHEARIQHEAVGEADAQSHTETRGDAALGRRVVELVALEREGAALGGNQGPVQTELKTFSRSLCFIRQREADQRRQRSGRRYYSHPDLVLIEPIRWPTHSVVLHRKPV